MDDISSKLKKLFKPKPKAFKGRGNVLGRAEEGAAPKPRLTVPSTGRPTQESQPSPPVKKPIPAGHRLGSAPASPAAPALVQSTPSPAAQSQPQPAGLAGTTGRTPAAAPERWEAGSSDADGALLTEAEDLELHNAAALLQSAEKAGQSCEVLGKVLRNILAEPTEPKYRRLRLTNKRIRETVVDVDGAIDVLQACGFELVFEEAGGVGEAAATEGFAVLPEHSDLGVLHKALRLLGQDAAAAAQQQQQQQQPRPPAAQPPGLGAAPPSPSAPSLNNPRDAAAAGSRAAQPAEKRPRNTQVLLPSGTDAQPLPDWIFERSPAELKTAAAAARRRQELEQMLMTRATRERLMAGGRADLGAYATATVRIRLPEGMVMQGDFSAGEPVTAVFEWLTECLANPGETYELIGPDRRPLRATAASLRAAELVPSALLNFRRLSPEPQRAPLLRAELLRAAH